MEQWIQFFTIIGALGFVFSKLDNDIKCIDGKIDIAHRRMDQLYQTLIDIVQKDK